VAVQLSPQRDWSPIDDMTGTGRAMGTADYMAPEQASDSRTVDIRADLYSLGCTLYKLLSGRAPFSGPAYRTTLEKLNAHVQQPPPFIRRLVPEVPERLAAILDRLLAKDPADRFALPSEVADALAPWCKDADLPALLQRALASPLPPGEGQGEGGSAPSPSPALPRCC
jgi:serine/threonine protein kinase